MTCIANLLDPNTRVETLQFHCRLERDDGAGVPEDEEARDVERAHQPAILRVGRREDVAGEWGVTALGGGAGGQNVAPGAWMPSPMKWALLRGTSYQ